jgi:hypothetical protein
MFFRPILSAGKDIANSVNSLIAEYSILKYPKKKYATNIPVTLIPKEATFANFTQNIIYQDSYNSYMDAEKKIVDRVNQIQDIPFLAKL